MRLALATLWILIAGSATAGVYWGFLVTPESTIWALMASAVLAALALSMAGLTAAGAIALWRHDPSMASLTRALKAVPGVVPAALVALLIWWIVGRVEIWITMRSGPISAWFIAQFGWDDMTWLFTAVAYAADWIRWVVTPLLVLSLMAGVLAIGWRALTQAAWVRRAMRVRTLAMATLWFGALIALPWIYLVPWRPQGLPATSIEFAFIVAKLSATAILFAVGAAVMAYEASRTPATAGDPEHAAAVA